MSNIIDKIQLSGVTYDIGGQGGGGKTIKAGRGISVSTGETADTVSFNLPISAGTGTNSIVEGSNTRASGELSHAEGSNTRANGEESHAEGYQTSATSVASHAEGRYTIANGVNSHAEGLRTIANNQSEHVSGQYNNSVSASATFGDSGNTLFSVGNGTSNNTRHNAFEIRQNGDIYLSSGGTDIKLQDHLGGGGGGTGGTEVEEMTQAEYDAASSAGTLDAETLYIITDAPEINANEYVSKAENTVSATTIYYHYLNGYSDDSWPSKNVKMAILDFRGDKATTNYKECSITIYDTNTSNWYYVYLYLDYTTGTFTKSDDYSIVNAEYDSSIEDFKFSLSDNYPNCYIRNIGFCCENNYIIIPTGKEIASGQTARVIETSVSDIFGDLYSTNLKNVSYVSLTVESDKFRTYFNKNDGSQEQTANINLEELKIDTNTYTLKPDINIPLGVSGWAEFNLSDNSCELSGGKVKGFTTFRISGDTTQLYNWNLSIAVGYNGNYNWDYVTWDDNENTFVLNVSWSDIFSAATATWDSNTGYLALSYPETVIVDGEERQTEFFYINSQNCQYGYAITKFEYYGEFTQPIKPYVQQLRTDVNTLSGQVDTKVSTSAVTSAVTSGSTDVLTSGGAYEQFGGLKIVKLTESQYAALVTKDESTLYVVIPDPNP